MTRWKFLLHPLLHHTPHLLNRSSMSDGLQRRFIEPPCDAAKVAESKAKVTQMAHRSRDTHVRRYKPKKNFCGLPAGVV